MKSTILVAAVAVAAGVGILAIWPEDASPQRASGATETQLADASIRERTELMGVVAAVASRAQVPSGAVEISSVVDAEWPDSCLGLADEGEMCAQMIIPGYEVTLNAGGSQYVYRINGDGSLIRSAR